MIWRKLLLAGGVSMAFMGSAYAVAGSTSSVAGAASAVAGSASAVAGSASGAERGAAAWWAPQGGTPAPKPAAPASVSLDPVFGPGADQLWTVTAGDYIIDRIGSRPFPAPAQYGEGAQGPYVLTVGKQGAYIESRTRYPAGIQITCMVRLTHGGPVNSYADFYLGRHEEKDPANPQKSVDKLLRMYLAANRDAQYVSVTCQQNNQPLHDIKALTDKLDWNATNRNDFLYYPRAYRKYLPGWPEDFRARVEKDMASIPALSDKWMSVRFELKNGFARFSLDDHVVAWKQDSSINPEGTIRLGLTAGVQLSAFSIKPLDETPGYTPIRLGGYLNGKTLLSGSGVAGASLPTPDKVVQVGGVPFVFPGWSSGYNHLDISRSLFRQGNLIGYFPAMYGGLARWPGSAERDPARIQLRVPNAQYDALYVIAASEKKTDTVPVLTAMFYRPEAGYTESFTARIPFATATSSKSGATPLPVKLANGQSANLWLVKIPLDSSRLTSFADMDVIEIELTKEIRQFRSYPDPICYGYHQAGLPSSVHVYAATLGHVPVGFQWDADNFGHVWTAPAQPAYTATVTNYTGGAQTGTLVVTTRSYDGTDETHQEKAVSLPATAPGKAPVAVKIAVPIAARIHGYYDIVATLHIGGKDWVEKRSFVRLAPDTRTVKWTEGKGAMFGYWSYGGGHHTPKNDHIVELMTAAGARQTAHSPMPWNAIQQKYWARGQGTAYYVSPQPWAVEDKPDPAKIEEFRKVIHKAVDDWEKGATDETRPDHILYFTESHISARLTAGNYPEYYGGEPFQYTDEEKERLKMFYNTAKIASEIIRKDFPERKILIEWGDPLFIVPLLRAGYPKELVDGSGLDVPNFERLPEMQLRDNAVHRLYELRSEYTKAGIVKPRLQFCEGVFIPTEPGAVSWREQMDIYNRWSLLSMAYGVDRFHSGWFAFDCGNYYGAEHYGGCGIQRRIPYCDPKPAYAAFATMTDRLNEANFDGWLKTGSLGTYCLRFKGPKGNVYTLWNLRGKRSITLTLAADGKVALTDAMNNTREIASRDEQVTITTDPSVIYVTGAEITGAQVGPSDNSDAQPAAGAKQVADLGDGTWHYTGRHDSTYENNHWGFQPFAGKFSTTMVTDTQKGKVLASRLLKGDKEHQLMPMYNVLKPAKPVELPYAPSHLGLWVKGATDWGRVIYICRDAKGERWVSIGTKDDYNCDDVHSWSSFNFDGWRYVRFELPGHTGYDSYRKHGTTWWRADAPRAALVDNIVDLPLRLEEIIVEQRSHILYVNDVQPAASDTVCFGKMYVEYENKADASPDAVRLSQLRMPLPTGLPDLPNPIAEMAHDGVLPPTTLTGLKPPEHYYDGTRMHVLFKEAPGAKTYHLWVSAHADGRGAVDMVPSGIKSGDLVYGLRPGVKLYYWITYTDEKGQMSKPSPVHEEVTVDNFKEK